MVGRKPEREAGRRPHRRAVLGGLAAALSAPALAAPPAASIRPQPRPGPASPAQLMPSGAQLVAEAGLGRA